MYKFNNSNIVTGLIKQKLHTFNLPVCKIFNSEEDLDSYINGIANLSANSSLYTIVKKYQKRRDSLVKVIVDKNGSVIKKFLSYYNYDKPYLNLTKNLVLENNIYDSYTHKYLGDYLRFERDYNNVNLLPLYNCYCNKLEQDNDYIYYYIPVKYGQKYTLCLNNIQNINYIQTLNSDLKDIQNEFNKKYNTIKLASFKKPYLLEINNVTDLKELGSEINLKIIIRLPKSIYTAIVCLEGDFTKASSSFINLMPNFEKENISEYEKLDLTNYISKLSLLQERYAQDKISYPFADKLIEYLLDNVITQNDSISNNIVGSIYNTYLRYTDLIEKLKKLYPNLTKEKLWEKAKQSLGRIEGTFTNMDRLRFNRVLNDNKLINTDNSDNLFYVDKDVELALNDERYPDKLDTSKSTDLVRLIYQLSSDGTYYSVIGYEESGNRLIVPDTYEGLPVKEIAARAFKDNSSLRSISLGENVTSIGANAFENCYSLKSINLSDTNLTTISTNAFLNCFRLLSATLPESITYMGEGIFSKCSALTKITIPFVGSNANPTTIGKNTFFGWIFGQSNYTGSVETKQYFNGTSFEPYSSYYTFYLPSGLNSVTVLKGKIFDYALNSCNNITKLTLGENLINIGYRAFSECAIEELNAYGPLVTDYNFLDYNYNLHIINIPNGVDISYIDFIASKDYLTYVNLGGAHSYELYFTNCTHLTTFISSTLTSITTAAFEGCTALAHVELPALTSIGSHLFDGCSALADINILNVVEIDNYAFKDCISLTSIDIPDTTTTIGTGVFDGCTGLRRVSIGNSIETLNSTFQNCTSIEEVIFNSPSHLTTLESTFYGCTSLSNIILPSGLVRIGGSCFGNCTALTSITIPSTVKYLQSGSISYQSYAFKGCTNLEHVYFEPNSVLEIIEAEAFRECSSLLELIIPDSVTKIGRGTFYGCSSLATVHLPASLTGIIGTGTFNSCSALTSLQIPAGVTEIGGDGTFMSCYALSEFTFASNSELNTFESTFYYCSNLHELEMPDSLQTLGGSFYSSGLNQIVLPTALTEIESDTFINPQTSSLLNVKILYKGDSTDWANINVHSVDYSSILYLYSETEPTEVGNWWHYVNGVPTVWNVTILTYELSQSEDYYILTGYQGEGIEILNIPATKNGLPVKEIANNKFKNIDTLTTISIPASIETIGTQCFTGCGNVTSITVDSNNNYYEVINNCLIDTTNGVIIKGCNDSIIPTDVNITTIGDNAFENCTGLTELIIPTSVTSIGQYSIAGCNNLETICFGNNISLGYRCFNGTTRINRIYFNGTIEDWCNIYSNTTLWDGENRSNPYYRSVETLAGVLIEDPELIPYVKENMYKFYILDPNGTITYNNNTYSKLTSITIPNNISSIQVGTFNGLVDVATLTLSNTMTELTGNFNGFLSLTTLNIPASINTITTLDFNTGSMGLLLNPYITTINIDSNNTTYDSRNNCNGIIETASNTLILGCNNTVIPNTVTTIGPACFAYNILLTSMTIPTSVTEIDSYAFVLCTSLTELTYLGTMSDWNNITLESGWNAESSITTIHCTDGDITL